MLFEERLDAHNPEVCNEIVGGLMNLHVYHMMSAQEWAMKEETPHYGPLRELRGQPVPEELEEEEEEGLHTHAAREHLREKYEGREDFLRKAEVQR